MSCRDWMTREVERKTHTQKSACRSMLFGAVGGYHCSSTRSMNTVCSTSWIQQHKIHALWVCANCGGSIRFCGKRHVFGFPWASSGFGDPNNCHRIFICWILLGPPVLHETHTHTSSNSLPLSLFLCSFLSSSLTLSFSHTHRSHDDRLIVS